MTSEKMQKHLISINKNIKNYLNQYKLDKGEEMALMINFSIAYLSSYLELFDKKYYKEFVELIARIKGAQNSDEPDTKS